VEKQVGFYVKETNLPSKNGFLGTTSYGVHYNDAGVMMI